MPLGPVASIEEWYADSRLGINTCSVLVWGCAAPERRWYSYLSRVRDKSSLYSLSIMQDVISRLDTSSTEQFVFWSDVGGHFRSNRTISTLGFRLLEEHGWMTATGLRKRPRVTLRYGMPKHFKNRCDLKFGQHNNIIKHFTKKNELHTVADVVQCLQAANDSARAKGKTVIPELVVNYLPKPQAEIEKWSIVCRPASLSVPIKTCFGWEFTSFDHRREKGHFMGVGANKDVITAVLCKALLLPGTKADPRNVRHPVIDAVPEPVAPAAGEPEPLHPVLIPDAGVLPEEAAEAEEAEEKAEEQVKDHRWKSMAFF